MRRYRRKILLQLGHVRGINAKARRRQYPLLFSCLGRLTVAHPPPKITGMASKSAMQCSVDLSMDPIPSCDVAAVGEIDWSVLGVRRTVVDLKSEQSERFGDCAPWRKRRVLASSSSN
jgi:hypothetical protein